MRLLDGGQRLAHHHSSAPIEPQLIFIRQPLEHGVVEIARGNAFETDLRVVVSVPRDINIGCEGQLWKPLGQRPAFDRRYEGCADAPASMLWQHVKLPKMGPASCGLCKCEADRLTTRSQSDPEATGALRILKHWKWDCLSE